MKAIINNTDAYEGFGLEKFQIEKHELSDEVRIISYTEDQEKGQLIISLYSRLFSENQQKIYIRDNKLVVIVSELVHNIKPDTVYISDWESYSQQSYIRMRNISMFLPGDNFYILRHYLVPEQFILNIVIGKLLDN